jgi:hypothetical protein
VRARAIWAGLFFRPSSGAYVDGELLDAAVDDPEYLLVHARRLRRADPDMQVAAFVLCVEHHLDDGRPLLELDQELTLTAIAEARTAMARSRRAS